MGKRSPSKMKKWPEGNATPGAGELVKPILAVIRQGYKMTRLKIKSLPYEGYDIGEREKGIVDPPDEEFKRSGLLYHQERDRDLLEVALYQVLRLGIEAGRRMTREDEIGPLLRAAEHYKFLADLRKEDVKGLEAAITETKRRAKGRKG